MSDDELYEYLGQIFEWDAAKARKNWLRHRVLFTEAATVYFDPNLIIYEDADHSEEEQRFIMIGSSQRDNRLFIVHVYRGEKVRIISARPVTRKERSQYESQLGR